VEFAAGEHVRLDHPAQRGRELTKDLGDQPGVADQGPVGPLLSATQGGESSGWGRGVMYSGLSRGELSGQPVGGRR
jgi:hypothetical protein